MAFRAFAVVGLCSAIFQPALAGDDKNRVFVAKRWYTESYVREYTEKNHPLIFRDIFSKQMSYNFAADGPRLVWKLTTITPSPSRFEREIF
ncbi:Uncharacterised protein [Pseudomonas putida]|nr:Uncharacterised protein [Pseudomonas putida]